MRRARVAGAVPNRDFMSDSQDTHGHEGPIKTPRQLIWTVVAAFVVPIMVIVLLVNFVATAPRPGAGSDLHSAEAVARRLMPVARIELAEQDPLDGRGVPSVAPDQRFPVAGDVAESPKLFSCLLNPPPHPTP